MSKKMIHSKYFYKLSDFSKFTDLLSVKLLLIPFLLLLFFICSCDIFDTRTPNKPDEPRANFTPPLYPETVIHNLYSSLFDKNIQNYLGCFSSGQSSKVTFDFSPSAEALLKYPVFQSNWTISNEEQYFNNLTIKINQESPVTLSLSDTIKTFQNDTVTYIGKYVLNVPHNDPIIPTLYQGDFKLKMYRDNQSLWYIFSWQDIKNSNIPTWSDLKGLFY